MIFDCCQRQHCSIKGNIMKKKAFTLIELLVVISIIALLMAILMPSLGLARKKAGAVVCMTNMKSLSLGWFMYQVDNKGKIMSGRMDGYNGDPGWINTPYNDSHAISNTGTTEVTDQDEINGIKDGALFPYLEDPDVFSCPSDKVKSRYDGGEKFVTVAVPFCLNGAEALGMTNLKRFDKIRRPAEKYNFVEVAEERNWIYGGQFMMSIPEFGDGKNWGWWSPMAVNHIKSSTLGFCDGHAINKKWKDSYTLERVTKLSTKGVETYDREFPPTDQTEDIDFMARGWPQEY